jgi:hypothetical protein
MKKQLKVNKIPKQSTKQVKIPTESRSDLSPKAKNMPKNIKEITKKQKAPSKIGESMSIDLPEKV